MSRLSRIFQNLFGASGDQSHFEQFGARALGAANFTKDPNTLQALSAFIVNGWKDAVNPTNNAPFLEDMNGLHYLIFYQLCYLMQEGNPEWDSATTYYKFSIVKKPGTFELYGSLIDGNVGNALPSQTSNGNWQYLNAPSQAPGIITAFAGSSAPVGTLLCDGAGYAQASFPLLYAAIAGAGWDTFNGASAPGAGNFRVPDLRGLTLMGAGQGTGFSTRTLAQLVGEENHTLVIAEMPTHGHGVSGGTIGGTSTAVIPGASGGTFLPVVTAAISINNTGGGGAHNNMQPSAGVNWIIKT